MADPQFQIGQKLPAGFFDKPFKVGDKLPADFDFSGAPTKPAAVNVAHDEDPGFWNTLGDALKNGPKAFMDFASGHPIQQISKHGKELGDASKEAWKSGDKSRAVGLAVASMLPGSGDEAVASGEEFGAGHPGAGAAHAALALLPFAHEPFAVGVRAAESTAAKARIAIPPAIDAAKAAAMAPSSIKVRGVPIQVPVPASLAGGVTGATAGHVIAGPPGAAVGGVVGAVAPPLVAGVKAGVKAIRTAETLEALKSIPDGLNEPLPRVRLASELRGAVIQRLRDNLKRYSYQREEFESPADLKARVETLERLGRVKLSDLEARDLFSSLPGAPPVPSWVERAQSRPPTPLPPPPPYTEPTGTSPTLRGTPFTPSPIPQGLGMPLPPPPVEAAIPQAPTLVTAAEVARVTPEGFRRLKPADQAAAQAGADAINRGAQSPPAAPAPMPPPPLPAPLAVAPEPTPAPVEAPRVSAPFPSPSPANQLAPVMDNLPPPMRRAVGDAAYRDEMDTRAARRGAYEAGGRANKVDSLITKMGADGFTLDSLAETLKAVAPEQRKLAIGKLAEKYGEREFSADSANELLKRLDAAAPEPATAAPSTLEEQLAAMQAQAQKGINPLTGKPLKGK